MFMVLKVHKMGVLNFTGCVSVCLSLLPTSMETDFEAAEPLDTLVQAVILHLCLFTNAFPSVLSRIAIFSCAPWFHLSKEGKEVGPGPQHYTN